MSKTSVGIYLLALITLSHGANILFFFGLSTYSHRITAWPLVEALAEKGHKVTFLQADKNKNPNPKVEELVIRNSEAFKPLDVLSLKMKFGRMTMPIMTTMLPTMGDIVCRETLGDPHIMEWINSNKPDLVVVDALFNDCALALAWKWKAQVVIFGTSTVFEFWPDDFGFNAETNWIGCPHFGASLPLSFLGRVSATLITLFFKFSRTASMFPKLEPFLKEKLEIPDMPSLQELNSNVSLVLMNTHFSEELARSLPPMVIPVGGMHCTDKLQPLPKDMEDFLNSSGPEGFIYVSFGSEVKISSGPKNLQEVFFNSFRNTKAKFLWKWEGPRPDNMPDNVFTSPWVPQQSVLAHPKIRLFITHGGLLSIQEALYYPVPMISFPVFAEQDYNAERVHRTKRGIRLQITTLTQEELENAINTILTDDTYLKNVKKASVLFKDRPQKPTETALWWVEYILRNKDDASVLRPVFAQQQYWFQRRLLDVWGFILAVLLTSFIFTILVLKKLLSFCFCRNKASAKTKQKVKKN